MTTTSATAIKDITGSKETNSSPISENIGALNDDIRSEIHYLARDPKHEVEKPYAMRYEPGGFVPPTNMSDESRQIIIRDFRPLQDSQNFEDLGFSAVKIDCGLTAREFHDEKRVEEVYYPAIKKLISQKFPGAAEIRILEHLIRKRHTRFHTETEELKLFDFLQPATAAHVDFSPHSAGRTARALKGVPNEYRRLLVVNFWKSFHGPGNDWPLALCDRRTIDYGSDSISADVVYPNRFTENERIYYSPKHEWYYFKDLKDDELIMFQQFDSSHERGGGVAHASFNNPSADEHAAPRESIELRAFVFYV